MLCSHTFVGRSMSENPESADEEGLDAAEDEIDEEPEPGLGPGADDENGEETDDEGEN